MKETIYTIPINEIFEEECFCPFCSLEKRLDEEEVRYALGPAMMEPDYRALTNEKGFCREHIIKLNALPKALPLALVFQSGLTEMESLFSPPGKERKKLFSGGKQSAMDIFIENAEKKVEGCVICDRMKSNIDRYFDTFADMLADSSEFFEKVESCGGFCMPHFVKALKHLNKMLGGKNLYESVKMLCRTQKKKYGKYREDINAFVDSFDYKNAGKPCPVPKDTVLKTGFFTNGEFEPPKKDLRDV